MRLIVITPDTLIEGETKIINSLFAKGLQHLHVRKPSLIKEDYQQYITEINAEWHSRIVVHNYYELYHEYKLAGVHLNSFARTDKAVWEEVKDIPHDALSTSFHSWEEIEGNTFAYGYVFISPVFDSISKAGYKAGIDLAELKNVKDRLAGANKYCPEIIGLGGVGANELVTLHTKGFEGGAMLGSIWQAEDPVAAFITAQEMANSLRFD